jgi:hypothetical protein
MLHVAPDLSSGWPLDSDTKEKAPAAQHSKGGGSGRFKTIEINRSVYVT